MKAWTLTTRLAIIGWVFLPVFFLVFFIPYRIMSISRLETWADYAGKLQAKVWFQESHYRLLELSPNGKTEFTGRKDGEFEIWTWTYYTNSSWIDPGNQDLTFVEAFNKKMKQLWEQKNKEQK
jgi:hypothetical protein